MEYTLYIGPRPPRFFSLELVLGGGGGGGGGGGTTSPMYEHVLRIMIKVVS